MRTHRVDVKGGAEFAAGGTRIGRTNQEIRFMSCPATGAKREWTTVSHVTNEWNWDFS